MRQRCFALIALGIAQLPEAHAVGDITLKLDATVLGMGNVSLYNEGTPQIFLALIEAANVVVPASTNEIVFLWSSASSMKYSSWVGTTDDPAVMDPPTLLRNNKTELPLSGTVPPTEEMMVLRIRCTADGTATFSITWNIESDGGSAKIEMTQKKECSMTSAYAPLPSVCSPSANLIAEYRTRHESAAAERKAVELSVASYNTKGIIGLSPERAAAMAESLKEFDVLLIQELFNKNTRETFSAAVGFEYVLKDGLANATEPAKQSSGLLIASRFKIVHCGFHEYKNAIGTDSGAAKGVAGALLDVDGRLVYVFNTHLQAEGAQTTRDRQMEEIQVFISSSVAAVVALGLPREAMSVLIGGDFNTRPPSDARIAAPAMLALLGKNDNVADASTVAASVDEPTGLARHTCDRSTFGVPQCPIEETADVESVSIRIDYIFLYSALAGAALQSVAVSSLVKAPLCCKGAAGFEALSDHPVILARLSVGAPTTAGATTPSIAVPSAAPGGSAESDSPVSATTAPALGASSARTIAADLLTVMLAIAAMQLR